MIDRKQFIDALDEVGFPLENMELVDITDPKDVLDMFILGLFARVCAVMLNETPLDSAEDRAHCERTFREAHGSLASLNDALRVDVSTIYSGMLKEFRARVASHS